MGRDQMGRGRVEWWEWCKIDMGRGGDVWSSVLGRSSESLRCEAMNRGPKGEGVG